MTNQNQPITKIPAVRTYAKDLEVTREAAGLPASDKVVIDEKEIVTSIRIASSAKNAKPVQKIYKGPSIIVPAPVAKKDKEVVAKSSQKLTRFNTKEPTFIVDNDDAATATIITDTKKNRFKLVPSIIVSIKAWFENQKSAYQKKKAPKYTVPETTRRKGVIQKATSSTGRFATSDFGSIQDRIKQRKLEDDKPVPGITWSPNTEPGYPLLPSAPLSQITNVKVEERKSFKNIQTATAWGEEEPVVSEIEVEPKSVPVIETAEERAVEIPVVKTIKDKISDPVKEIAVAEVEDSRPVLKEVYVEDKNENNLNVQNRFKLLSLDTNTLSLGIFGLVLAIILVCTYGYFTLIAEPVNVNNNTETRTDIPLLDIPLKAVIVENASQSSLTDLIKSNAPQGVGNGSQLVFVSRSQNNLPIAPNLLLTILNINLEQNFKKTISVIRFGYTPSLKKFVALKSINSDSVKGGLLIWEGSMREDFSGVFELTESPDIDFVDAKISGLDVRVLKNKDGAEEIIYGQIDDLIIITENSTDFSQLINLKK
jgi:hypothetical protein